MGGGMGGGIEKQQHSYYTQSNKAPLQQQQMHKSTGGGLAKLTGGKSEKTEESKSKSADKFVGGEGEGTEEGKEGATQYGGTVVGGFLKTGSKERKTTVGRKVASDDTEVEEDSEVSETSSTSSVDKAKMGLTKRASDGVTQVSGGRRTEEEDNISDFINDWLRIKRSPGAKLSLGEVMSDSGRENNIEPFILLAIAATESEYGKKGPGLNGLMGMEDVEGPEEQIVEGALLFNHLRENGEADLDDTVSNQIIAVNRSGWCEDGNWHKSVFKYYQEIKRAWERYSEMKS